MGADTRSIEKSPYNTLKKYWTIEYDDGDGLEIKHIVATEKDIDDLIVEFNKRKISYTIINSSQV